VALAAAWVALSPMPSWSDPVETSVHRRVLLLVDKPGDPFVGRIKAEISSLGLEVAVQPPVGSLEADARAEGAVAAIRMLPSRKGVEVWMADETSGRSLLRQVIVDETAGGPDHNLIALQTAELLRTSLLSAGEKQSTTMARKQALLSPAIASPVALPQSSGQSGAQVGVGFLYGAGGASTALQAWLSLQHVWGQHFGVALDLSAPLRRGTLGGPEGSSDIGAVLAGGELLARFETEGHRAFLATGLGAGFASVVARGHPSQEGSAQLVGGSSSAYVGLGYLRVNVGWKATGWLGFGATGLAGTTAGRVHIRFAGNDAGDWGVPLLAGVLFGEVDWR